ncbi:MAG: zinc-dependent metalloprotease [Butyricimonas faecihominis]
MYKQLADQYYRSIMNVMYNVGGIYLTEVKDVTKRQRHVSVSKEIQKASLAWILKEFKSAGLVK